MKLRIFFKEKENLKGFLKKVDFILIFQYKLDIVAFRIKKIVISMKICA